MFLVRRVYNLTVLTIQQQFYCLECLIYHYLLYLCFSGTYQCAINESNKNII
jgi:hypothetical protein